MNKLIKIIVFNILKSKFIVFYTILLFAMTWSIFNLEDNVSKGMLSLLSIILLTIPLVSIMYATTYVYNSGEFIELLVSQPVKRSKIWISLFIGLSISLCMSFFVGAGLLILIHSFDSVGIMMNLVGLLISIIFIAIAMLCTILTRDKAKGIGVAIISWLFFALLFDGIILFLLFQLSDYPIEKPMIGFTMLNPIALARILILLHLDVSALMGYTGAIFKEFYGTKLGILITFFVLICWSIIPFIISLKKFKTKDL